MLNTGADLVEKKWAKLSAKRQRHSILMIFLAYFILSVIVMSKACHNMQNHTAINIEHINNPILKKTIPGKTDSLTKILKYQLYERQ